MAILMTLKLHLKALQFLSSALLIVVSHFLKLALRNANLLSLVLKLMSWHPSCPNQFGKMSSVKFKGF